MMKDVTTRRDLELLMDAFYAKLLKDPSINYIFTEVAGIDLMEHLPHIVDFWEQNILGTGSYRTNVLQIHLALNDKSPLSATHFSVWLDLFGVTLDEMFEGTNSNMMKTRALSIATVMQVKMRNAS